MIVLFWHPARKLNNFQSFKEQVKRYKSEVHSIITLLYLSLLVNLKQLSYEKHSPYIQQSSWGTKIVWNKTKSGHQSQMSSNNQDVYIQYLWMLLVHEGKGGKVTVRYEYTSWMMLHTVLQIIFGAMWFKLYLTTVLLRKRKSQKKHHSIFLLV